MYELEIEKKLREITSMEEVKLSYPPSKLAADLSTNAAMASGRDPAKIAAALEELDIIESAVVAGPGFINMKLTKEAIRRELKEIAFRSGTYGSGRNRGKVIFEMVSSNPTGPLHIGHGRGAVIGDSLARIYEKLGYSVYREYYVNDTGKQMHLLGESIFSYIEGKDLPPDGYRGDYISDIADELSGCCSAEECTKKGGNLILNDHFEVLEKFGVRYDNVFRESGLIEDGSVENIIDRLKQMGLTYEKDGALWFRSARMGDDSDRVLVKGDGELTYFATDCAYHADKAARFDLMINIWGADHHGYVARMKAFFESMGYEKKRMDVLLYQLVNLKRGGENISMSTRAGEFVTLREVIDEVGTDAARFFMLMRSADAPLEFDLELAKEESKKNPVYYVQYSHARICSIFEKAGVDAGSLELSNDDLLGPEERAMVSKMAHFPMLLEKCRELNGPHLITDYLRDLATGFHKYYDTVRVLGSESQNARLVLLRGVKNIIESGLELAGVSAPEKM